MAEPAATAKYAFALVAQKARELREAATDAQKHETSEIAQHRLAEVVCECAWCEREYGEAEK